MIDYTKNSVAEAFCIAAHESRRQRRKYTLEPYYRHPIRVRNILFNNGIYCHESLCAALLHDVIEDTEIEIDTIYMVFGLVVARLVNELTDVSRPSDGNREKRKKIDRINLMHASPSAQTIKYADLIDNTYSIVLHDHDFAKIYLKEKILLLDCMDKGDESLRNMAYCIAKDGIDKLMGI